MKERCHFSGNEERSNRLQFPELKSRGCGAHKVVTVKTSECGSEAEEALAAIPEVLEVHDVAGEDCFLLKIRTKDTDALTKLHREKIRTIPSVISTKTIVVLQTYKETNALPLEGKARKG